MIDPEVFADAKQPKREGGTVFGQADVSFHKGVRHDILGKALVSAQGQGIEQGRAIMLVVELFQKLPFHSASLLS